MGRGSSGLGGGKSGQPKAQTQNQEPIDLAQTAQEAFDALALGEYLELKTPGDRYSSGVWLVYRKMVWGFDRVSLPGYYSMPGDSMVLKRDFSEYDNRWRKLSDYARNRYGL